MRKVASIFAPPTTLAGKKFEQPSMHIPKTGQTWMLTIRGFEAASRGFSKMPKDMEKRAHKKLLKIWMKVFDRSQATCPVGTYPQSSGRIGGMLKRSGEMIDYSKPKGEEGEAFIDMRIRYGGAGSGVDYAVYVHEGHVSPSGSWVKGIPWLVRSAMKYRRSIYKVTKEGMREVWNSYAKQVGRGAAGTTRAASQLRMSKGIGATVSRI